MSDRENDYADPQDLPCARASARDVLVGWACALVFIAVVLTLLTVFG